MKFHIHGENSIIIYFDKTANRKVLEQILVFEKTLQLELKEFYKYSIPSYVSLLVFYDIHKITASKMLKQLKNIQINANTLTTKLTYKTHEIIVDYNFKDGLDLQKILDKKSINLQEFITIHTGKIYDVYSVGFLPNFAYLGNLDKKICMPRLKTPRKNIAKNSVGIADCQTGIYPQNSPAGWNIIGIAKNLPEFFVGDKVKFISS
jgi:inhibitor of KinA